jgi:hypothetical protein
MGMKHCGTDYGRGEGVLIRVLTLGSVSMHCHARARTSISRGEKETPSSLAIATVSGWYVIEE